LAGRIGCDQEDRGPRFRSREPELLRLGARDLRSADQCPGLGLKEERSPFKIASLREELQL
jgi:hypothetical protein